MERSWVDRIPLAGWRGSATGIYDHDFKFWPLLRLIGLVPGRRNHRLKVCRLGETHPELLDAAISGFVQISESSEAQVRRAVRTSSWVSPDWFLRFRWVVSVGGNVAPSSFYALLGAGSTLVRQDTPSREFCAPALESGRHFVPVSRDLSDLIPVLRELAATGEGEEIARAGRSFARTWLTAAAIDAWIQLLLLEWARARPRPEPHPGRVEVPTVDPGALPGPPPPP